MVPGQEQTTPNLVIKFWRQQKAQITLTMCWKFQNNLFEFWFYTHFLNYFIHVNSPGAKAGKPLGSKFLKKAFTTSTICCKFQKNLFEFWFYTHFLMFFHMYIATGQRQTTLCVQILMSTERPYHFAHVLQVSKKYLWSLILYIFLPVSIHVYNPGAGADNALGSEFLF